MSMIQSDLLLGQEGGAGYAIERSLRFNAPDSSFLSRTPASAGNRKTFTFSTWVKLCNTNNTQNFLNAGDNSTVGRSIFRYSSEKFGLIASAVGGTTAADVTTDAVFRDFSAWYHLLWAVDTTQATSTNRVKLWVNGVAQQLTFTTAPDLDGVFSINNNSAHRIGGAVYTSGQFPDYYLADCFLIDGQALTPSSFAETNATTGQWVPKAYTGTYGTNGFRLDFSDNSAATATTLGKDRAGSNNWTPSGLSVTAGAGNDALTDTPTSYGTDTGAGGEVRGNYCTANPLKTNSGVGFSNGNLDLDATTGGWFSCYSTIGITSGKWYWEATMTTNTSSALNAIAIGICPDDTNILANYVGATSDSYGLFSNGNKVNSASQVSYGSSFSAGDIAMVAFDDDSGKIWFGKNGTWFASGDPAAGTNAAYTSISATRTWIPVFSFDRGRFFCNFGQRQWAYAAPAGFKALCDQNLPAPTIARPSTVMDVKLYTGNGSTQTISGLGFSPDFVWLKMRSTAGYSHKLVDTVRGATISLVTNNTNAELTEASGLTAFTSDGFSLGSQEPYNRNSDTFVAWAWDAGTTTSSNGSGSITSSCRTNQSSGFSIVGWTGNGAAASIGHGLNVEPHLIIHKFRGGSSNWSVYTKATGAGGRLKLNTTESFSSDGSFPTTPTSSLFYVNAGSNDNGVTMIAYCFAPVAGYSSFGSYTGNGTQVFVYTGFKPRWILLKTSGPVGGDWFVYDTARDAYNVSTKTLSPNLSGAEVSSSSNKEIDILSNGFLLRADAAGYNNYSGWNYIYFAVAESPFAYSRAR